MRLLCAPDSFKETISAGEAAQAMATGAAAADSRVRCDQCPLADGGEGTLVVLAEAIGAEIRVARVCGPRGAAIESRYGVAAAQGVGIVELAEASGLALLGHNQRDPTRTTTFGTGELIMHTASAGCDEIIIAIGGSATVDGGVGLAQALGAVFFDERGARIDSPITGGMLQRITRFEPPQNLPSLIVACDVDNPLLGPRGAAAVYGPQKGANEHHVRELEAGLHHLAELTGADSDTPHYGAAGGAGFGLAVFCGARLRPGIDLVLDAVQFDRRCAECDAVITGEGKLDDQSFSGKVVSGVCARARKLNKPVFGIFGTADLPGELDRIAAHRMFHSTTNLSAEFGEDRARNDPASAIRDATRQLTLDAFAEFAPDPD